MSGDSLRRLAEAAAISLRWNDYRNEPHEVSAETLQGILSALGLPCDTDSRARESIERLHAEGVHSRIPSLVTAVSGHPVVVGAGATLRAGDLELVLEDGTRHRALGERQGADFVLAPIAAPGYHTLRDGSTEVTVAVAPPQCFGIAQLGSRARPWGIAAQLYSLRRPGDGGIGDFTALAQFAGQAAAQGADAVAISPVHAQFGADVHRFGPYAPSSRLFLNALHADPEEAFGHDEVQGIRRALGIEADLKSLEAAELVEWPAAADLRYRVFRNLYKAHHARFSKARSKDPLASSWRSFRERGGDALEDHARFEALHAVQFGAEPDRWHWRTWPEEFRSPRAAAVAEFARKNADEVSYHVFLQWLADRGFAAAQHAARSGGMSIGLISDLAVGTDSGGSHAWSRQDDMLVGLSVGAPPDLMNLSGQNWGLTAFSPRALHRQGFRPFIETLRASLRHAGGLRIDHILGLQRLWLIPDGASAAEGAYLRYPLEDMLRLIALESYRHRAIIVGEDLGTVPEGFRDRLDATGILGMRVMWFENQHDLFVDPRHWSRTAMATTSTHDVATVGGWWTGLDLQWRGRLDLFAKDSSDAQERRIRERDRTALWNAFLHAGSAQGAQPASEDPQPVVDAAVDFVGRTPSPLVMVPVEDMLGTVEQLNIPGTTSEHPNWRRRLSGPVDSILDAPRVRQRAASLRRLRGTP